METSVRRSSIGGKETKRGTSPSSSTIKKTSPKPSSSSSTPTDENTTKSVPNYLKPTMSSSLDFSRIPAKKSTTDHGFAQKPAVDRRRSFERPPPSSQVSRAIRGPPSGTRDIKPQRSSSFSIKSTNTPSSAAAASTRPGSEKLYARTSSLKDRKVVGPQMSKSYSLKRTAFPSTSSKKEPTSLTSSSSSSSAAKKPPRSVTSESSVDYESRSSVDHLIIEDDFVNIDDSEVQSLPEMSEMPESSRELADPTNVEVEEEVEHVEEAHPKERIVVVEEEDHQPCHEHVMEEEEEPAVEKQSEKTDHHQSVEQESAVVDDQTKVELAEEQNLVRNEQDESDIKVVEVVPTETMVEETIMEEEMEEQDNRVTEKEEEKTEEEDEKMVEEVKEEKMVEQVKEEKMVEETVRSLPADTAVAAAASATATATATGKTQGSAAGKKDKQAYNDVIEETATKLMGNKSKNKVLALAGAFETVISLQDTKKS
ncbi:hypothetical protein SOVF_139910 [Spinacia oleracea]|uniref:Calmodulin-binding domain-containing protein n=1 Tax=Spinacia oleracea TaxID=3562 RepID=A0A9R0IWW6_SPIOL|nr:uncharacterized protein LOC110795086 [Spinacia oleracea]KNA10918.1 hypothetical protein SOVF_139910 [Spinacia oleracea]